MNIGYVTSVITHKLIGIMALSDTYFVYYFDDHILDICLEIILQNNNIAGQYGKLQNGTVYYELTNWKNKNFLAGVNFLLPWPYQIAKVEYKNIDHTQIYDLYTAIQSNQEAGDDNSDEINKKSE